MDKNKVRKLYAEIFEETANIEACIRAVESQNRSIKDFLESSHVEQDKEGFPRLIGMASILMFEDGGTKSSIHGAWNSASMSLELTSLASALAARKATGLFYGLGLDKDNPEVAREDPS